MLHFSISGTVFDVRIACLLPLFGLFEANLQAEADC
jgi:hypothetical protein